MNKSQDAARPGTRLSVIRQRSLFAGAAALSLAAVGCGGGAKPVPPLSAELSFSAGSSVNVYRGEAKPVEVLVVQLAAVDAFLAADARALAGSPSDALGDDLLEQQAFILPPGEVKRLAVEASANDAWIGVAAIFRDAGRADWKAVARFDGADEPEASGEDDADGVAPPAAAAQEADIAAGDAKKKKKKKKRKKRRGPVAFEVAIDGDALRLTRVD